MKQNWVLIAALLAILAVPFGLALFEDATRDPSEAADTGFAAEPEVEYPIEAEVPPAAELERDDSDTIAWERTDTVALGFIDEYLSSDVGLGGELESAVRFGEPPSDAAVLLEARFNDAHDSDSLSLAIGPDPQLYASDAVSLVSFRMSVDPRVSAALRQRWGPPATESVQPTRCAMWTAEASSIRAVLETGAREMSLSLSPYRSLDQLLASKPGGAFGFEPVPLVGASIGDIAAEYGDRLVSESGAHTLLVEPAAASARPSLPITLIAPNNEITEISATVDLSCDPGAPRRARRLLEDRVGPVSDSARIGEAEELRFEGRPDVSAFVYPDRVIIVRRR